MPRGPGPIDSLVGRNIRVQRMAKGLSQTALGDAVGVTFQQMQKYERGINRVGMGRLVRIAEVLELPVMALLDGAPSVRQSDAPSPLALIADRQPFRLVEAFSRVEGRRLRNSLVRLVESLAQPAAAPTRRLNTRPSSRRA
jgi:transcriptional regulator with XRE-family HTH domain